MSPAVNACLNLRVTAATEEVLRSLGYTAEQIDQLVRAGVIG
ncbi:MAG: hypothetical protein AB1671_10425 [Thermodesulfobacteriota bacterium]